MADTLSMAFLMPLEALSPVEGAVFLLHDVFGYECAEVAETLGKREDNARQLAARARRRIEQGRPRFEAVIVTPTVSLLSVLELVDARG